MQRLRAWQIVTIIGLFHFHAGPGQARAGDAPEKKKPDVPAHGATELYDSLANVINAGARIFNDNNDHAGCYRMFEGALMAVRPYVAEDLQVEVDRGLERADRMAAFAGKAFELRRVLDLIRARYRPAAPKDKEAGEEIKGEFKKLIDDGKDGNVQEPAEKEEAPMDSRLRLSEPSSEQAPEQPINITIDPQQSAILLLDKPRRDRVIDPAE